MLFDCDSFGHPARVALGAEMRRRRQALGLTLEELADRANVSTNYLGTLERGRRDPSISTVMKLAKGLRVRPSELLGGVPEITPAAYDMARAYDGAPEEIQDIVARVLKLTRRRPTK